MTALEHALRVSTPGGGVQGMLALTGTANCCYVCHQPHDQDVP
jgi:hypothetical protein